MTDDELLQRELGYKMESPRTKAKNMKAECAKLDAEMRRLAQAG
jgi:hypothetical protein